MQCHPIVALSYKLLLIIVKLYAFAMCLPVQCTCACGFIHVASCSARGSYIYVMSVARSNRLGPFYSNPV